MVNDSGELVTGHTIRTMDMLRMMNLGIQYVVFPLCYGDNLVAFFAFLLIESGS